MMRSLIKILFVAIAMVSLAGVSAEAQRFAGGHGPKHARSLDDQIFKKLISLPNYGLFDHITYQLNGGTVVLNGSVISLGTKSDAERSVRRIPGVTRVVNNIRELPPSPFDNQIRRSLVRQFANSGVSRYLQGPNPSVRIIVDNGHVSLEGYVSNRSDANLMRVLALGVSGVFSVDNHLMLSGERAG